MLRGEIRQVELGAQPPNEAAHRRLAVIVSNDGANLAAARSGRGVVTVVPLTSNVEKVYPFQVLVPGGVSGLERDSKAQAEQVRSISTERVKGRVGVVSIDLMHALDNALRLHLSL